MDEPLLGEKKVVKQSGKARLIIVDTTSDVREDNDTDVIVTGSHGGKVSGDYLSKMIFRLAIPALFFPIPASLLITPLTFILER